MRIGPKLLVFLCMACGPISAFGQEQELSMETIQRDRSGVCVVPPWVYKTLSMSTLLEASTPEERTHIESAVRLMEGNRRILFGIDMNEWDIESMLYLDYHTRKIGEFITSNCTDSEYLLMGFRRFDAVLSLNLLAKFCHPTNDPIGTIKMFSSKPNEPGYFSCRLIHQ